MPALSFHNRQRKQRPDLARIRKTVAAALPACLAAAKSASAPLHEAEEIEITVISDRTIARVHADFLDDPTPTDVITFHHGEILISADTAARQAAEHGQTLEQELALYAIHGLLHLGGWDDHEPEEAAAMAELQFRILRQAQDC